MRYPLAHSAGFTRRRAMLPTSRAASRSSPPSGHSTSARPWSWPTTACLRSRRPEGPTTCLRRVAVLRRGGALGLPENLACWSRHPSPDRTAGSICPRSARTPLRARRPQALQASRSRPEAPSPPICRTLSARPMPPASSSSARARTDRVDGGPARAAAPDGRNAEDISDRNRESADRLGAARCRHCAGRAGGALQFSGVDGHAMTSTGLASLYPIDDRRSWGHGGDSAAAFRHPHRISDRGCGDCDAPRRPRHYRQSRLHPSGRPAGAGRAAGDPDRELRLAVGLGMAARACPRDARLCRSWQVRAGAAAIPSRTHARPSGSPPCTSVGHPHRRGGGRATPER